MGEEPDRNGPARRLRGGVACRPAAVLQPARGDRPGADHHGARRRAGRGGGSGGRHRGRRGADRGARSPPPELAEEATSVALAIGTDVDRAELLGAWGERFEAGYRQLAAGATGPVLAAYRDRLETLGRQVRADRLAGGPVCGTFGR